MILVLNYVFSLAVVCLIVAGALQRRSLSGVAFNSFTDRSLPSCNEYLLLWLNIPSRYCKNNNWFFIKNSMLPLLFHFPFSAMKYMSLELHCFVRHMFKWTLHRERMMDFNFSFHCVCRPCYIFFNRTHALTALLHWNEFFATLFIVAWSSIQFIMF